MNIISWIGWLNWKFVFRSHDIIKSITNLRARGQEFLNIPDSYYDMLRKRLANSKVKVKILHKNIKTNYNLKNLDVLYSQIMVIFFLTNKQISIKYHQGTSRPKISIQLQSSTSSCIQVHQATIKNIKAQLELQLTSKTSSSIEGHLEHPQKCDGVLRPN